MTTAPPRTVVFALAMTALACHRDPPPKASPRDGCAEDPGYCQDDPCADPEVARIYERQDPGTCPGALDAGARAN